MKALCVTVDLDRDVNIRIPGEPAAGSIDRGSGTGPRFSSSMRGLSILAELFDEMSVKATFFAEAATLSVADASLLSGHEVGIHGVEHEDISAIDGAEGKSAILEEASAAVKDAVGRAPECYRAPYMSADDETIRLLPDIGIKIDSSRYAELQNVFMPERIGMGIWEMPVPKSVDSQGRKISSFLWPMHESQRKPEDYIAMASVMEEGVFLLATHTWHMVESREKGMMSEAEVKRNIGNVRKVIEEISDMGMTVLTLTDVRKLLEKRAR